MALNEKAANKNSHHDGDIGNGQEIGRPNPIEDGEVTGGKRKALSPKAEYVVHGDNVYGDFYHDNRYGVMDGKPCRTDRFVSCGRADDLHLSAALENKSTAKDDHLAEETFCSNFVCCGIHLADLHALLQHYEDVHVKIAKERTGEGGDDFEGDLGERPGEIGAADEELELDVVGDGGSAVGTSGKNSSQQQQQAQQSQQQQFSVVHPSENGRYINRADSVQSFGSCAAADALLGVGLPYNNSVGQLGPPAQPLPGGYNQFLERPRTTGPLDAAYGSSYYDQYGRYYQPQRPYDPHTYYFPPPPPPHYYRGEAPVSAFDTTILRSVSPVPGGVPGNYPMPPGYPGYYYHQQFQGYSGHPHHLHPIAPAHQQPVQPAKRPRSALPSMKAVAAASNILRESLPPALMNDDRGNQFRMIYSILSNTIEGGVSQASTASGAPALRESLDEGHPAAAEALLAMDPKHHMSQGSKSILPLQRAPVDKTLERPYICPVPGCGKSYKNPNGLKYHAAHGHDGTSELVERPYKCPYGNCGNRYKNPNGLKYHVNKHHADMLPKSAVMAKAANAAKEAAASALIGLSHEEALLDPDSLPADPDADDTDAHDQSDSEGFEETEYDEHNDDLDGDHETGLEDGVDNDANDN